VNRAGGTLGGLQKTAPDQAKSDRRPFSCCPAVTGETRSTTAVRSLFAVHATSYRPCRRLLCRRVVTTKITTPPRRHHHRRLAGSGDHGSWRRPTRLPGWSARQPAKPIPRLRSTRSRAEPASAKRKAALENALRRASSPLSRAYMVPAKIISSAACFRCHHTPRLRVRGG
jgi:hypothetical protein